MANSKAAKTGGTRPDIATLGGLVLAVGGILTGLIMDGGKIKDVAQVTAALIVLGGTIGAVMVTTPLAVLLRAGKKLGMVFFDRSRRGGHWLAASRVSFLWSSRPAPSQTRFCARR